MPTKSAQQYWDDVSATKEFTTPFQRAAFERYVGRQAAVLDVGCGYGRTLHELYEQGYRHLTGLDFAAGMIRRGRAQWPELDLRAYAGPALPLPDASADAVILFAVLTCIPTDAAQEALLAEITRVLKPGGVFYCNDFLLNDDPRNLARYAAGQAKYGTYGVFELPEGAVLRHHDEGRIKALFAGFEELEYERLRFTTMNGHSSNGFYFMGRRLG